MSETTRIEYGKSSIEGTIGVSARSASSGELPLLLGGSLGGRWRVALEHGVLDRGGGLLAGELVLHLRRAVELGPVRGADLREQRLVDPERLEYFLFPAHLCRQIA